MPLLGQFASYCVVGGVNTGICVALMAFGHWLGWAYVAYTLLGYAVAMAASFWLNFIFTFRARGQKVKRMQRFAAVNLLNLAGVQALQFALIDMLHLPTFIGIGIAMVVYTVAGFQLNRVYVFGTINKG